MEEHVHEVRHSGDESSWIVSNSAILSHGIGMIFAWSIFIALGSITGRYFKPPNNRWFGWFPMHASLQFIGVFQSCFWVFIIATHVQMDHGIAGHLDGLHPWLGFFLFLASIAQPIIGWFAHKVYVKTGGTSTYHTVHRWLARIIWVTAIITMTLGVARILKKVVTGDSTLIWLLYSVLICIAAVVITYFELKRYFDAKKKAHYSAAAVQIEMVASTFEKEGEKDMRKDEEEETEYVIEDMDENELGTGVRERSVKEKKLEDSDDFLPTANSNNNLNNSGEKVGWFGNKGIFGMDDVILFTFAASVLLLSTLLAVEMYLQRAKPHGHKEEM